MKSDRFFRDKTLKNINYSCSDLAQKELKTLSPQVKSLGVIIYPDGGYMCWDKSIYSEKIKVQERIKSKINYTSGNRNKLGRLKVIQSNE